MHAGFRCGPEGPDQTAICNELGVLPPVAPNLGRCQWHLARLTPYSTWAGYAVCAASLWGVFAPRCPTLETNPRTSLEWRPDLSLLPPRSTAQPGANTGSSELGRWARPPGGL